MKNFGRVGTTASWVFVVPAGFSYLLPDATRAVDGVAPVVMQGDGVAIAVIERNGRTIATVKRGIQQSSPNGSVARSGGLLVNGDFSYGLNGWSWSQSGGSSSPGQVVAESGHAAISEGDSFLVTLQQSFFLPGYGATLSFDLVLTPGFDQTDNFIPDAFEASLLDSNGNPIVPTWDPLATSFFNMQEDGAVLVGAGVTWNGTTATVDLSAVGPHTGVTLYFDFIGADSDTAGGVRIDNVRADCAGDCIPAVSTWGLIVMALAVLSAGTLILTRRRPTRAIPL